MEWHCQSWTSIVKDKTQVFRNIKDSFISILCRSLFVVSIKLMKTEKLSPQRSRSQYAISSWKSIEKGKFWWISWRYVFWKYSMFYLKWVELCIQYIEFSLILMSPQLSCKSAIWNGVAYKTDSVHIALIVMEYDHRIIFGGNLLKLWCATHLKVMLRTNGCCIRSVDLQM